MPFVTGRALYATLVMTMRMLLITPYYAPGIGGAVRLLQGYVEFLLDKGYDVEVLTYGEPLYQGSAAFDQQQSYRIHRIPARYQTNKTTLQMGAKLIQLLLTRRFDLIVCGVAYPSALLALVAKTLFRVPFAVYSHGEDASIVKDSMPKFRALSLALRSARSVMVNSGFTRREIELFKVPAQQIVWIPPGIDPEPYLNVEEWAVASLRKRLGLEHKRVVLTVARLQERKGHDTIVRLLPDLAQSIPNVHYLIIGKGDASRLEQIAAEGGVSDRLTIVPFVEETELPVFYHACDVYAMVSRYDPASHEVEGFGMVYLEAGACQKPSVAGSAGGAAEAVEDGITGIVVNPTDPDQIHRALVELLTNTELATTMGRQARNRTITQFHRTLLYGQMERACVSGSVALQQQTINV